MSDAIPIEVTITHEGTFDLLSKVYILHVKGHDYLIAVCGSGLAMCPVTPDPPLSAPLPASPEYEGVAHSQTFGPVPPEWLVESEEIIDGRVLHHIRRKP